MYYDDSFFYKYDGIYGGAYSIIKNKEKATKRSTR